MLCSAAPARAQEVQVQAGPTRTAALALMGSGALGMAAGIAFGVVSVVEHRRSRNIERDAAGELEYQDAIDARDDFRVASGVAGGVGLGLFLVGGALYVLDIPSPDPADEQQARVTVMPLAGPGVAGGALTVRF
jgi:hypothetical protein